jgi:hypothetical protein
VLLSVVAITVVAGAWAWRDARPFGEVALIGLPERIDLCGRSYDGGGQGPVRTVSEVRTVGGFEPVIVDPWLHPPCVPGACTDVAAAEPCHSVVFVRVGRDTIVGYDLQGGP